MTDAPRVLLVEDDPDIADLLELHLTDAGYRVEPVRDGAFALQLALSERFDLIVLDLMLPGLNGVEVCRTLREKGRTVPVLMLTAQGSETDRVLGLETGADDYVPKPFSVREVLARVRALLRRVDYEKPPVDPDETLEFGALAVYPQRARVEVDGEPVEMTKKELELLVHLARHPGRVFSRQELLDDVWGVQFAGYGHTVNTHINRLRAKVEPDPSSPQFVQTVWGVGYRFAESSSMASPTS